MAQKYRIEGILTYDIDVVIEAMDETDAENVVEMLDCSMDGDGICLTSLNIIRLLDGDVTLLKEADDPDEEESQYQVKGRLEVEVTAEVEVSELEGGQDAISMLEEADLTLDGIVSLGELELCDSDYDNDPFDMNYDKWVNHMTKAERIKFLTSIGVSDDDAYETAGLGEEDYDKIPEEWMFKLEV